MNRKNKLILEGKSVKVINDLDRLEKVVFNREVFRIDKNCIRVNKNGLYELKVVLVGKKT